MSPVRNGTNGGRLRATPPALGSVVWIHGAWAVMTLLVLVDLTFTRPTLLSRDWGPIRQYFPDLPLEGVLGYGGSLLAIWGIQTLFEMGLLLSPVLGRDPEIPLGRRFLRLVAALALLALVAVIFFAATFVG